MRLPSTLLAACLLAAAPAAGAAATALAVSSGGFNVGTDDTSLEAGLELRLPARAVALGRRRSFALVPTLGAMSTSEGAVYGYTGFRVELALAGRWSVAPNFAAGAYTGGDDKDLGHGVEFRSGIEVAYAVVAGGRIGLALYHLSNAGLGKRNPGSESLILTYSFSPGLRRGP